MKPEQLKDKKWDGICPVPECGCYHHDEDNWYTERDIKSAVKWLKQELKRIEYDKVSIIETINEAFEDVM